MNLSFLRFVYGIRRGVFPITSYTWEGWPVVLLGADEYLWIKSPWEIKVFDSETWETQKLNWLESRLVWSALKNTWIKGFDDFSRHWHWYRRPPFSSLLSFRDFWAWKCRVESRPHLRLISR